MAARVFHAKEAFHPFLLQQRVHRKPPGALPAGRLAAGQKHRFALRHAAFQQREPPARQPRNRLPDAGFARACPFIRHGNHPAARRKADNIDTVRPAIDAQLLQHALNRAFKGFGGKHGGHAAQRHILFFFGQRAVCPGRLFAQAGFLPGAFGQREGQRFPLPREGHHIAGRVPAQPAQAQRAVQHFLIGFGIGLAHRHAGNKPAVCAAAGLPARQSAEGKRLLQPALQFLLRERQRKQHNQLVRRILAQQQPPPSAAANAAAIPWRVRRAGGRVFLLAGGKAQRLHNRHRVSAGPGTGKRTGRPCDKAAVIQPGDRVKSAAFGAEPPLPHGGQVQVQQAAERQQRTGLRVLGHTHQVAHPADVAAGIHPLVNGGQPAAPGAELRPHLRRGKAGGKNHPPRWRCHPGAGRARCWRSMARAGTPAQAAVWSCPSTQSSSTVSRVRLSRISATRSASMAEG